MTRRARPDGAYCRDMNDSIRAGWTPWPTVAEQVAEVKPHLRGWLHLATAPVTLAAGIVLIALSPTAATRWGSAVYVASAVMLFTTSAIYHRGRWSPRVGGVLRRADHANIFLLIAGTYTPFCLLLLSGTPRVVMLAVIWSGALLGIGLPGVLDGCAALVAHARSTCSSAAPRWSSCRSSRAGPSGSASASASP